MIFENHILEEKKVNKIRFICTMRCSHTLAHKTKGNKEKQFDFFFTVASTMKFIYKHQINSIYISILRSDDFEISSVKCYLFKIEM